MIIIRDLKIDDPFDDLIALSYDFFQEYQHHHPEFFRLGNLNAEDFRRYFARLRDSDSGKVMIALDGERMVGYITVYTVTQEPYWQVQTVGHISGLMVHPSYRRQGIASRLLDQAQIFFKARSIRYFTVYTAAANQAAIAFYEKKGLVPLHTTFIGETHLTSDP